jgi:hypothetical protein
MVTPMKLSAPGSLNDPISDKRRIARRVRFLFRY